MDFETLKIFHSVSQTKNITETAASLHLNKSTVSRKISQLEEELGKPLFHKLSREIYLTPYGEFFLEKVKNILSEVNIVEKVFRGAKSETKDLLSISSTHALISTWLTRSLKGYMEMYPDVSIHITAENTEINQIWKHSDIALRPFIEGHPELAQEWIMRWVLQLYASKEYLKRYGIPTKLEDLDQHRIIIFAEANALYSENYTHWPLFIGTKFGNQRKPVTVLNSLQGMYNLVKDGIGIGAFAKDSPLFFEQPLIPILPDLARKEIEVYCIYPKGYGDLGKIRAFVSYLKFISNSALKDV